MIYAKNTRLFYRGFLTNVLAGLWAVMRNPLPSQWRRSAHDITCAELERLAQTGPHLLADIGFRKDRPTRAGVTTWRRSDLRVERVNAPGAWYRAVRLSRG